MVPCIPHSRAKRVPLFVRSTLCDLLHKSYFLSCFQCVPLCISHSICFTPCTPTYLVATPSISHTYILLRLYWTPYVPLLVHTHVPFRAYPTPHVSHQSLYPTLYVSHPGWFPLLVCPTFYISHSVYAPLCVYPSPMSHSMCIQLRSCHARCSFHSMCFPLCVTHSYIYFSRCLTPHQFSSIIKVYTTLRWKTWHRFMIAWLVWAIVIKIY